MKQRPGKMLGFLFDVSSLLFIVCCALFVVCRPWSVVSPYLCSSQPLYMENLRLNLHAPWSEVRELLKEANIELTDEDLNYEPGREDELLTRLESKLGKSKSQVKAYIESVSSNRGIAG
jgi:hypothetical protein